MEEKGQRWRHVSATGKTRGGEGRDPRLRWHLVMGAAAAPERPNGGEVVWPRQEQELVHAVGKRSKGAGGEVEKGGGRGFL